MKSRKYGYLDSKDIDLLPINNFHHRSCKAIEKRLKDFIPGCRIIVYNTTLFGTSYYYINTDCQHSREDIAKILCIPVNFIENIHCEYNNYCYIIQKYQFNTVRGNDYGEIDFPEKGDEWTIKGKDIPEILDRLAKFDFNNDGGFSVEISGKKNVFIHVGSIHDIDTFKSILGIKTHIVTLYELDSETHAGWYFFELED